MAKNGDPNTTYNHHPQVSLKPFEDHGVVFTGETGNQRYGRCPFTDKEDKFYVNVENGLWDSKTAGLSGNVSDFLEAMAHEYEAALTEKHLSALAENRKLPVAAFKGHGLGWSVDKTAYTLPIRDLNGKVVDIRYARLGKAFLSTAGCKVGLLGAPALKKTPGAAVVICEGEWDFFATHWTVVKKLHLPLVVVAVPGAGTLKPDWVAWMTGRVVHTLYDHDDAGKEGELVAQKKLGTATTKLTFVHWPKELPDGFDARDWFVYGAVKREDPEGSWKKLQGLFRPETRLATEAMKPQTMVVRKRKNDNGTESKTTDAVTLPELHASFNKWLLLKNNDAVDVTLAVVLSQRLPGDPVWMFMVGPPGSGKTATLQPLSDATDYVHVVSSITPHTLISGASGPGGADPSLIPRLNNKTLVVKDFTVLLGMHEQTKEEIFDIFRDAYDGKCAKEFGNGIIRRYESRFTVLAAVTTVIYDAAASHAALGERFLKFSVGDNIHHYREEEVIRRAMDNSMKPGPDMASDLTPMVAAFLDDRWKHAVDPTVSDEFLTRMVHLGKFTARLRGTISREQYNPEMIKSRAASEVGTRLGIQLTKLARALAMVYGHTEVGEAEYRIVKKVALDTVTQRVEDFVRALWRASAKTGVNATTQEIAKASRYPMATTKRVLEDLAALDVITCHKDGPYKFKWSLSAYILNAILGARLYEEKTELERVSVSEQLTVKRQEAKKVQIVFKPQTIQITKKAVNGVARLGPAPPTTPGRKPVRMGLLRPISFVAKSKR